MGRWIWIYINKLIIIQIQPRNNRERRAIRIHRAEEAKKGVLSQQLKHTGEAIRDVPRMTENADGNKEHKIDGRRARKGKRAEYARKRIGEADLL